MMLYMDKYLVVAWFFKYKEATEYQTNHPELKLISFQNGWAYIKEN